MIDKTYEERLRIWREFREKLDKSHDPIQDVIDFYYNIPEVSLAADPYTPSTWPDPWELLEENNYCSFVKILAICYTLQLTDVLSTASCEIHITYDKEKSKTFYLLYVNNYVIGYKDGAYIDAEELPKKLQPHQIHPMPPLQ